TMNRKQAVSPDRTPLRQVFHELTVEKQAELIAMKILYRRVSSVLFDPERLRRRQGMHRTSAHRLRRFHSEESGSQGKHHPGGLRQPPATLDQGAKRLPEVDIPGPLLA